MPLTNTNTKWKTEKYIFKRKHSDSFEVVYNGIYKFSIRVFHLDFGKCLEYLKYFYLNLKNSSKKCKIFKTSIYLKDF